MDALEAIMTRRSVREYTKKPVPEENVRTLLAAAMQAPFAGDKPPWHFIVIDDPRILARIPMIGPYARVSPPPPLAILISTDLTPPENPGLHIQTSAAAAQNLLLAAHALGLGAVWTAVYPDADRMLGFANLFSLPETVIPFALVTVGCPAARPPPVDRYREDRVHYNAW